MFLTIFYMIATWVQSWRLSSLRTRLQTILQGPEASKPSIMLYTSNQLLVKDEMNDDRNMNKSLLSSHLCNNNIDAKLGDLLWYQGDKWLCTIYPQQKVDISDWLKYPTGKTIFPLFSHNNSQASLLQSTKMHVLIEADLFYIPQASSKATKLEDYGLILTWMTDNIFGVILETDLDHITKFSTTLMQGQCFINNGLPVTRIESVSVSGKPCICNYEAFNLLESSKIIGRSQWLSYVQKLKRVSNTAKLVSQQHKAMKIKKIPGLEVTPGCEIIPFESSIIAETTMTNISEYHSTNSSTMTSLKEISPSPTNNSKVSKLSQDLNKSLDSVALLNSSVELSSKSDLNSPKVQKLTLEDTSHKNVNNTSIASSSISLTDKIQIGFRNNTKRPNILICADSAIVNDNVCSVLKTTLKENKYTIYPLSMQDAQKDMWMDQTNLIIVCGNVEPDVASQVVEYIVRGGKLLALCSDILKIFIPAFKTAEIRENELVRFSYGKWKYVCMLHHIFCYQASPVKTKFSQDPEESNSFRRPTSPIPVSTSVHDQSGKKHTFNLKILGSEDTWHTPCILLANQPDTGGQAVFSQIHLEVDPFQYEFEESKFTALKNSNTTRLEIFSDILSTHLDIEVDPQPKAMQTYSSGFFLGRHELKLEMLKRLKDKLQANDVLKTPKLEIQFCNTSTITRTASSTFLPVLVHRCPENFATVEYFENLNTEEIGRLVIYADVMTSSNDVVNNLALHHGLAIIPYQQTNGQGRGANIWLSPEGCAMFTLQLHIPLNSVLGERISLIQYLTSVAVISAVKLLPGYQDINIRIKWPNDIYTGTTKIGGVLVTSFIESSNIICNIGLGVNLSNSSPTTCINDIIADYNERSKTKLRKLTYEEFLARVFSQIESLLNIIQSGNIDHFYDVYYKHWMHTDADIRVMLSDNSSHEVRIIGIDTFGFLEVKGKNGKKFTVQPDGNSFDILKGLIAPKC